MEVLILGALKWRMRSITPFSFIPFFISFFKLKDPPLTQALIAEMDPPLVNESSFSVVNPSAYSLAEIWPFGGEPGGGALGLRMGNLVQNFGSFIEGSANRDGSAEKSTVTEQSGGGGGRKRNDLSSEDESSKMVSTSSVNYLEKE